MTRQEKTFTHAGEKVRIVTISGQQGYYYVAKVSGLMGHIFSTEVQAENEGKEIAEMIYKGQIYE